MSSWVPLSDRANPDAARRYETLVDGMPSWLVPSIERWVSFAINPHRSDQFAYPVDVVNGLQRALRLEEYRNLGAEEHVLAWMHVDDETALNVLDALLHFGCGAPWGLEAILLEGGSAWKVRVAEEGEWGLERRVDATVSAAAESAVNESGRAGRHLAAAWARAYGRDPDPSGSFRESVKAVEAAAKPIVTPTDKLTTLGKMIAAIDAKPSKWTMVLQPDGGTPVPVDVACDMMRLLWRSQLDRHGTDDEAVPLSITQVEAEAAVHIATTLVHWFSSGAIALA